MTELGPTLRPVDATHVQDERGARLTYFGGCDYFRLSWHPKLRKALSRAMGRYGLTVAASRTTTGNHPLYQELEERLADYFGARSAVLVANGYMAGMVLAQGCHGAFAQSLIDDRAHASLWDAAAFLGCPARVFEHGRASELARQIQGRRALERSQPTMVLTNGMMAHDGSVSPLRAYRQVLPQNAVLLVDDAHGAGVLGSAGRGSIEHEGLGRKGVIQTITLSKAFGLYGGAILCDEPLRRRIQQRSRIFTGNTPLPLPWAAAALVALDLLGPGSELRPRLQANARRVKEALMRSGWSGVDTPGPVVSVRPRDARTREKLKRSLRQAGIYPCYVVYPGGPEGGHFRFAISSEHSHRQINGLVEVLTS